MATGAEMVLIVKIPFLLPADTLKENTPCKKGLMMDARERLTSATIGSKAPAIMGGHWLKVEHGWQWNGGTRCPGRTFPNPGGDWNGTIIEPEAERH